MDIFFRVIRMLSGEASWYSSGLMGILKIDLSSSKIFANVMFLVDFVLLEVYIVSLPSMNREASGFKCYVLSPIETL